MIHQFELYIFRLIQAYGWQKADGMSIYRITHAKTHCILFN